MPELKLCSLPACIGTLPEANTDSAGARYSKFTLQGAALRCTSKAFPSLAYLERVRRHDMAKLPPRSESSTVSWNTRSIQALASDSVSAPPFTTSARLFRRYSSR